MGGVLKQYIGVVIGFYMGYFFCPMHQQQNPLASVNDNKKKSADGGLGIMDCLDIQVDNDVNNRVIPLQSDVDKCLLYEPPQSAFIELVCKLWLVHLYKGDVMGDKVGVANMHHMWKRIVYTAMTGPPLVIQ